MTGGRIHPGTISVHLDYYRGDPVVCLQERKAKLQAAAAARRAYWEQQRQGVSSTT